MVNYQIQPTNQQTPIHTHTHTYIYIYIWIFKHRQILYDVYNIHDVRDFHANLCSLEDLHGYLHNSWNVKIETIKNLNTNNSFISELQTILEWCVWVLAKNKIDRSSEGKDISVNNSWNNFLCFPYPLIYLTGVGLIRINSHSSGNWINYDLCRISFYILNEIRPILNG